MGNFSGKRATLVGLARTNISLARFLVDQGADVTFSEMKTEDELKPEIEALQGLPVRLSLGGHRDQDILGADVIFVTPGASRSIPCLVRAQDRGIPISSEIELLFELCPAPIIGITGSSGKTTTTTLVGEILKADGRHVLVGGNIGTPLIDRLDEIGADSWVVLELSSFQLEYMARSPRIAAVTNITPNHLDRHATFEAYVEAKKNIVRFQRPGDCAVLNLDDPESCGLAPDAAGGVLFFSRFSEVREGAFLRDDAILVRYMGLERTICTVAELGLRGKHNVENALAAAATSTAAGAKPSSIAAVLTSFTGVEHRLELVREVGGAKFYNDSIATTPERTIAGLRSFDEPIVLIAGGKSKHLPLDTLVEEIGSRVRVLILMGELGHEIDEAIGAGKVSNSPERHWFPTMAEAIARAIQVAAPDDVVLLSPGGTSFDEFRDFEDRGNRFKQLVREASL
ncbi:MAG: UDP-N-acetylmuramoyl-L-alanine--D-glutamate ligase [Chloroflexi bacterium]|nr:UDP-N-acetylmuramoyl-L-alanine--D-glutamate ligase [Chloroflexota bacterium]